MLSGVPDRSSAGALGGPRKARTKYRLWNDQSLNFFKKSVIQDHSLAKLLTFFPVFHWFTSERIMPKLKLNIFAHLKSPLKIFGEDFPLFPQSLKFHPSEEPTYLWDETLHDVFSAASGINLAHVHWRLAMFWWNTHLHTYSFLSGTKAKRCTKLFKYTSVYCSPHAPSQSVLPTVIQHEQKTSKECVKIHTSRQDMAGFSLKAIALIILKILQLASKESMETENSGFIYISEKF